MIPVLIRCKQELQKASADGVVVFDGVYCTFLQLFQFFVILFLVANTLQMLH